jgi:hypothetical protein
MNTNEITRHLDELAGDGVPANVDLWPQLRAQVGTKQVRRASPRRRAGALIAAAVLVLALALGALTPAGTNAATGALGLIGLQPIALAPGGPGCVGAGGSVDPTYTPAEAGTVTVVGGSGEPLPAGTAAAQAMQITCPEGYELSFTAQPAEANSVLTFFGVTTTSSTTAAPSCVGEGGTVDVIQTPAESNAFTIALPSGSPMQSTAGTQISCPEGYQLTFGDK